MDGIERPAHHPEPAKLLLHGLPAYWSPRSGLTTGVERVGYAVVLISFSSDSTHVRRVLRASDRQQLVDHRGQLVGRPAFVHRDHFLVARHRRITAAPKVSGLGVQPVRVPAGGHHVGQQVGLRVAVVGAPVAEHQQRAARRQHIRERLHEGRERVAVVGMSVAAVDTPASRVIR